MYLCDKILNYTVKYYLFIDSVHFYNKGNIGSIYKYLTKKQKNKEKNYKQNFIGHT